jgi:hypothetical protein
MCVKTVIILKEAHRITLLEEYRVEENFWTLEGRSNRRRFTACTPHQILLE